MSENEIETLLQPYMLGSTAVPPELYQRLAQYLELLLKWNARTNLTAIRDPEEIVHRHFGESLFAAQHLPQSQTLLDFGSGAGFPGLPIQLLRPEIKVTLAESQNKKATFLREAVRTLGLTAEVWSNRVEAMPHQSQFEVVTLRAVDNMKAAIEAASIKASRSIVLLTTSSHADFELEGFTAAPAVPVPLSTEQQLLWFERRNAVT